MRLLLLLVTDGDDGTIRGEKLGEGRRARCRYGWQGRYRERMTSAGILKWCVNKRTAFESGRGRRC